MIFFNICFYQERKNDGDFSHSETMEDLANHGGVDHGRNDLASNLWIFPDKA